MHSRDFSTSSSVAITPSSSLEMTGHSRCPKRHSPGLNAPLGGEFASNGLTAQFHTPFVTRKLHKSQNILLRETPKPSASILMTSKHGSFLAVSMFEMNDSRMPTLSANSPCSKFFSRRNSRSLAPKRLRIPVDTP